MLYLRVYFVFVDTVVYQKATANAKCNQDCDTKRLHLFTAILP